MKRTVNLFDSRYGFIYTVDATSMIFRLEAESENFGSKEIRLKPFHATILHTLFKAHPMPVNYDTIAHHLKDHHLQCPDSTRLHRKVSEIRVTLSKLHPNLNDIIQNTRGVGYGLPIFLTINANMVMENTLYKIPKQQNALNVLQELIKNTLELIKNVDLIKHDNLYIIDRQPYEKELLSQITQFDQCEKILINKTDIIKKDFKNLRLRYLLLKMRTYIEFARIQESRVPPTQLYELFDQEIWTLYGGIVRILKSIDD